MKSNSSKFCIVTGLVIIALSVFTGCSSSSSGKTTSNDTSLVQVKDEPYYKYSWHIDSKDSYFNTRGYTIDENADINILEAWKITKGKNVKVAVIDDAFDVEHEDLKENIFITYNADEDSSDVGNKNPLGFTDAYGNVVDGSHGNTCAGFIVAPVNGKGIIGTAPEAKLIAIKQLSSYDGDTIRAFEYAKNQGAKVISCSWGTEDVSQAVVSELKSLYDAGITVLFAAGNDGKTLDAVGVNDESEVEWVIGIGASGENNDITVYSNYGSNIDIVSPGGDTDELGVLGIDDTGIRGSTDQLDLVTNNYAFTNGTSFSAPVAAGIVALMYSVNPAITPSQVRTILIESADKIGTTASYNSDAFDEKRAYGKINAIKAVVGAKSLL